MNMNPTERATGSGGVSHDLRGNLNLLHLNLSSTHSINQQNSNNTQHMNTSSLSHLEQDDRLWYLALSFSFTMSDQNKSFDIYKALSRMENQNTLKKSSISDILSQLYEHREQIKIIGKYGKLYCNDKGRWVYKQDRSLLKSSSLRFLGNSMIGNGKKGSLRTFSIEEPSPSSIYNSPTLTPTREEPSPNENQQIMTDPKLLRRFSTTDAKASSSSSSVDCVGLGLGLGSGNSISNGNGNGTLPSPGSDNSPSTRNPVRRKSGYLHSLSARSVHTVSDESANGIPFDQLYSPHDEVQSGAGLPLTEQSEIILTTIWEELLPAMIIYESFLQLGAAWLGDGSTTSVAASQRRLLQKVNSRTAILNTTNLIDQMKFDRTIPTIPQSSPRVLSRTPSNASLCDSDDVKNVRTIDTDLLNELLNDIEDNVMIMPDLVDTESDKILILEENEKTRTKSHSSVNLFSDSRERTHSNPTTSGGNNAQQSQSQSRSGNHKGSENAVKELTRMESNPIEGEMESPRSKDRDSSTTQSTPRDGDESQVAKSLRFAPSVPLKRPSWNTPTTPLHFARKRRPGMVVRLALSQNGPFQKILMEGVRVVIHCLFPNERRPRRLQRVMILQDDRPRNDSWRSDSFDINDFINTDSPTRNNILKLKFHKFEMGVLIETTDEITVTNISEILTGVHTSVFKKSLDQLYGDGSSYEKSGTEKRCFSMIGCVSPYDERHCLDIEIQPVDKQKPEELQAASMISLGVATAIQVMSNLANTKDVHEIGVIGSLSNVFKSVHDKSPEDSVSESHSLTASSIGTKNSRNTTPPDSRRDSGDDKSAAGTVQSTNTGASPILGTATSTTTPTTPNDTNKYNERLVTSLRLNPISTGSPNSLIGKRFKSTSIPTILESVPSEGSPGISRGMKRNTSKGIEEFGGLNSSNPRNAFEKHRPRSFTLAPSTPLTPAMMAIFDGQLPSEQYTINYIMQEVVELWTAGDSSKPQQRDDEDA